MKNLAPLILLLLANSGLAAEVSIPLNVAATVLPEPCETADQSCDPAHNNLKAGETSAVVTAEEVQFVGSRPSIVQDDGVTTLLF